MGRFGHEGAMPGIVKSGKPLVYYMSDDSKMSMFTNMFLLLLGCK